MSKTLAIKVLAVHGNLKFRDKNPTQQRAIDFKISEAQESELKNGKFDVVALIVPEQVIKAGPVWLIKPNDSGNVPPNFWTARAKPPEDDPREDHLFAVWIPPHASLKYDASLQDMKRHETHQHMRTIWGVV